MASCMDALRRWGLYPGGGVDGRLSDAITVLGTLSEAKAKDSSRRAEMLLGAVEQGLMSARKHNEKLIY